MSHATQLHDRGYLADYRQIMHRCALPGNVQEEIYRQVHARALETVKWTLEQALDEEVRAYLGRARYERAIVPRRPEEMAMSGSSGRSMDVLPTCVCPNCAGATAIWLGRRSHATNTVGGHY